MTEPELLTTLAVFGGLASFIGILAVVGVRIRRAADARRLALRAAQVAEQCKDLLLGPEFLWAVWNNTASAGALTQLVRNPRDELVSTITTPALPLDGVIKRFELAGRQFEVVSNNDLLSNRSYLRESGHDEVLLSASLSMNGTTFFRGTGDEEMFHLPQVLVTARFRPIRSQGAQIGKLVVGFADTYTSLLTLPQGRYSVLEQVFVIALA